MKFQTRIRVFFILQRARVLRRLGIVSCLAMTACDPVASTSVVPDRMQAAACILESIPAGAAALDDAQADLRVQRDKIRTRTPIIAADIDGGAKIVNVALNIITCMEPQSS